METELELMSIEDFRKLMSKDFDLENITDKKLTFVKDIIEGYCILYPDSSLVKEKKYMDIVVRLYWDQVTWCGYGTGYHEIV